MLRYTQLPPWGEISRSFFPVAQKPQKNMSFHRLRPNQVLLFNPGLLRTAGQVSLGLEALLVLSGLGNN
jgi:hypothetical protein